MFLPYTPLSTLRHLANEAFSIARGFRCFAFGAVVGVCLPPKDPKINLCPFGSLQRNGALFSFFLPYFLGLVFIRRCRN